MAEFTLRVQSKISRLRHRCGDNKLRHEQLDKVLWWSLPIVYTNYHADRCVVVKQLSARSQKRKRVRRYVAGMIASFDDVYLASFTFDDEHYFGTSRDTRDRYIKAWLKEHSLDHFTCLDIGKENGREHYHSIICFDYHLSSVVNRGKRFLALPAEHSWPYGFCSFRPLRKNAIDMNRTLNYALKSSDYAFKSSSSSIKPWHKRGVEHWCDLRSDSELELPL